MAPTEQDVFRDERDSAADRAVRAALSGDASDGPRQTADLSLDVEARRMLGVWREMDALQRSGRYDTLLGSPTWRERLVEARERYRASRSGLRGWPGRLAMPTLAAGALAAAAGLAVLSPSPGRQLHYAAQAEARAITLPDQSSVVLGPASTLSFEIVDGERVARLDGEAEMHVTPDPSHPFLVKVGQAQVRVVGTRFTLAHRGACTQLSVQEGTVELASPAMTSRRLEAGEEGAVIDDARSRQSCLGSAEGPSLRWSYIDAPLAVVLADVAPFYPQKIIVGSPDLGRERVTISFTSERIGEMVDLLPEVLDVRNVKGPDGTITISR